MARAACSRAVVACSTLMARRVAGAAAGAVDRVENEVTHLRGVTLQMSQDANSNCQIEILTGSFAILRREVWFRNLFKWRSIEGSQQ